MQTPNLFIYHCGTLFAPHIVRVLWQPKPATSFFLCTCRPSHHSAIAKLVMLNLDSNTSYWAQPAQGYCYHSVILSALGQVRTSKCLTPLKDPYIIYMQALNPFSYQCGTLFAQVVNPFSYQRETLFVHPTKLHNSLFD